MATHGNSSINSANMQPAAQQTDDQTARMEPNYTKDSTRND